MLSPCVVCCRNQPRFSVLDEGGETQNRSYGHLNSSRNTRICCRCELTSTICRHRRKTFGMPPHAHRRTRVHNSRPLAAVTRKTQNAKCDRQRENDDDEEHENIIPKVSACERIHRSTTNTSKATQRTHASTIAPRRRNRSCALSVVVIENSERRYHQQHKMRERETQTERVHTQHDDACDRSRTGFARTSSCVSTRIRRLSLTRRSNRRLLRDDETHRRVERATFVVLLAKRFFFFCFVRVM